MAEHDKRDQSPQMATAGASADTAPFVDDIVIWVGGPPDERPRKLTREALAKLPQVDEKLMPPLNDLIKQGVVIAAIPTTSGIGAACYLINLTTLKKP
jgi:hypothetical protein